MQLPACFECKAIFHGRHSKWKNLRLTESFLNFHWRPGLALLCGSSAMQFGISNLRISFSRRPDVSRKVEFRSQISLFLTIGIVSGCPNRQQPFFALIKLDPGL
jgi:hypothetical protein